MKESMRYRACCASETAVQKEEQLRKYRLRDRVRRAAETDVQRAARLARLSANQSERLQT